MRVSNNMNYEQVKNSIGKNRGEMSELQNQAATQKRITKPSDDAVGTSRMLGVRTDKLGTEQFIKNLDVAKTFLNYTESALGELSNILIKAKELAISQASEASSNAGTRLSVATEVDQMFNDLVNIGNRKYGERFIFGGFKTMTSPFDFEGQYSGDKNGIRIETGKGVYTLINMPGDRVFHGRDSVVAAIPEDRRGATTPNYPAAEPPKEEEQRQPDLLRGPASVNDTEKGSEVNKETKPENRGENIFKVFKSLSNGLRANDTVTIQGTLERIDSALDQVITLRSEVGSRVASLENSFEGLSKNKIDQAALLSSIEDADPFEVFTDITKNENVLKATLQTSGKLIQPSLLDFLR